MKKFSILFLSILSTSVFAYDGQIKFTGEIIDQGCTITSDKQSQIIPMGKISQSTIGVLGTTSSPTNFSITLENCPETVASAKIKFDGKSDELVPDILSLDEGTTAKGIGIEISDENNNVIKLHTESNLHNLLSTETNELKFIARYRSNGDIVSSGDFTSTTNFTITYN